MDRARKYINLRGVKKLLALAVLISALASLAPAHDIPADITVQAFLKPEGQRLHFLVRVPLKAMRDIEFPKRGPGYLEFNGLDKFLNNVA